jgi:hypothetical protein
VSGGEEAAVLAVLDVFAVGFELRWIDCFQGAPGREKGSLKKFKEKACL